MAFGILHARAVADLLAGAAVVALAVLVLSGGRRARVNRFLALLFVVMGVGFLTAGPRSVPPIATNPILAYNALVYSWAMAGAQGLAYLAFVGEALRATPLGRPLAHRAARWAILGALVASIALTFAFHAQLLTPDGGAHPAFVRAIAVLNVLAFGYGLVAALDAFRRSARGGTERDRARRYLVAFAVNDLGLILYYLVEARVLPHELFDVAYFASAATPIVAAALLGRALLVHQLFDFDLRVKWTLSRGTLVAAFLGVFFVVAAVAEQWLQRFGVIAGGIAIGLMLFALRPLEAAAARLADRLMPNVRDTEEYRTVRKREVYRAAVDAALADGGVTDRERLLLATLADSLGLTAREVVEIERAARAERAVEVTP